MRTPICLGRVLTIFSWGFDLNFPKTTLTIVWRSRWRAHLSPDGTPGNATWSWRA